MYKVRPHRQGRGDTAPPRVVPRVSKKFSYSFLKLRCQVFTDLIDVILKRAVLKTKIELHSALIFF